MRAMFYRDIAASAPSTLTCAQKYPKHPRPVAIPGLFSRLLITGSALAAPLIALAVILIVQGLSP